MEEKNMSATGSDRMVIVSVQRALRILNLFQHDNAGLSFTDIMEQEGLPKTTIFRMLNTLVQNGFLRFDERDAKYSLGSQVMVLGCIAMGTMELSKIALPVMENLRDLTGETVTLYVRRGAQKVCIQKVESDEEIRLTAFVGKTLPIHAGASGIILLSGMDSVQLDEFLRKIDITALTPFTISDRAELKNKILDAKTKRYCVSMNERQMGAAGIGTPVINSMGQVVASLNISGPVERFDPQKMPEWINLLIQAGSKTSQELGYRLK